jgi:antitoxin YefM
MTYTYARAHFAAICDAVASSRQAVVIRRRGAQDVALVAADELWSLMETAHLLRSPKNAERLLRALGRARRRRGSARSVANLRRELGLGDAR